MVVARGDGQKKCPEICGCFFFQMWRLKGFAFVLCTFFSFHSCFCCCVGLVCFVFFCFGMSWYVLVCCCVVDVFWYIGVCYVNFLVALACFRKSPRP